MVQTVNESKKTAVYFKSYENKFKALADNKRLELLCILSREGAHCVCDLSEKVNMSQSKLSYHLKLLLEAGIIIRVKKGTWNYYEVNVEEMSNLLSDNLCCVFRP